MWRALDEDSSGFLIAGEFCKFMRKGYEEMLKEQQRIKSENRPVWTAPGKVGEDKPNFKELQAERLRKMHEALRSNIRRLEAESARLEAEAEQAEAQLRQLAEAKPSRGGPLSPRGGPPSPRGRGPASPRSRTSVTMATTA